MNTRHSSSSATFQPVLTRNIHRPGSERITTYLDHGGYQAVRKALAMKPEEIIKQVKQSGCADAAERVFLLEPNGNLCPRIASSLK